MNIFFITEKRSVYEKFVRMMEEVNIKRAEKAGRGEGCRYDCFYSEGDFESETEFRELSACSPHAVRPIKLKDAETAWLDVYDMFFSWHCRQIFPRWIVEKYRCINLHPSYNPYNRGWYPQIFSIYNGYPAGVTIHEMDAGIDTGCVICQRKVEKRLSDTGRDLYDRIVEAEESLVRDNLEMIISGDYEKKKTGEGNINYKKDFVEMCRIDRAKQATYGQVIDHLRALTFGEYRNAWYADEDGNKVYIRICLERTAERVT